MADILFPRIGGAIEPPGPNGQRLLNARREARLRLQAALVADIAAGIRVLSREGVPVTEEQIAERANNIACGILGNFRVEEIT